ncbi:MAG: FHA domain-containing protein [Pirellulales bacterium]|jgi:predicted component of type VI protein secretion system|nr:hypothetical protein [Rhodopirellula sp.]MCH2369566.1 FHA domain-containing protein [Pirellulales bacterium]|tara:strand:- start:4042 stop:4416 length:375 start_codon:yes stop_codon:yes gene_type:complete
MTLTLIHQSYGDDGPTRALMKPSYPITLPALLVPASTELETPVRLNKYPVLLGRSESADIRLDDRWLSRNHCEIDVTDGELIIRDLGSKHGTYVNESPIDETTIESGDELRIGITRFVVEIPKE